MIPLTDFTTNFDAVQARHEPIEDRQPRCIGPLQELPRLNAITRHNDLMPSLDQRPLQEAARNGVIIGNEDFHVPCSPLNMANACARRAISCSSSTQAGSSCVTSPRRPSVSS